MRGVRGVVGSFSCSLCRPWRHGFSHAAVLRIKLFVTVLS
jgi:hypothetical protein